MRKSSEIVFDFGVITCFGDGEIFKVMDREIMHERYRIDIHVPGHLLHPVTHR